LAEANLVGLLFGNSPKAMAFWGGVRPMIGTNPIAFAAPLPGGAPLVIDFAVSVAARGGILAAHKSGKTIPPDWALNEHGEPTTNAAAALRGSMAPAGGAKGAALALMIEVIAAAVTGSHFGFEASSFLDTEGSPPNVGQVLVAIDPNALSNGAYFARMATLMHAMAEEDGVRQPGASRLESRRRAAEYGLAIPAWLLAEIRTLAGELA
jgi:(2R)-3-sulfolactate dehydrogenase (NADP+)